MSCDLESCVKWQSSAVALRTLTSVCWTLLPLLANWVLRELKAPVVCGPEAHWPVLCIHEVCALRDACAKRKQSFLHRSSRQKEAFLLHHGILMAKTLPASG